jgi:hypothetical protein
MRARIPIVLACAALLAVACQDTPTEPVEQPVATVPEFNFMNGPASPGNSGIERYAEPYTFNYSVDMEKRWLLVTYDVWEGYAGCTLTYPDPALMEPWDVQQKQKETRDGVLTTWLLQGEHDVYFMDHLIYDQSEYDWDTEVCPWVMDSWVYKGTAKFVVHREFLDGELVRRVQSGNGVVEDRDGNLFKLNYHERVGTNSDQLQLEFTPIGDK